MNENNPRAQEDDYVFTDKLNYSLFVGLCWSGNLAEQKVRREPLGISNACLHESTVTHLLGRRNFWKILAQLR